MGITVNKNQAQTFHISGGDFSYVMAVTPEGQLVHLYYGPYVHESNDFSFLLQQTPVGYSLQFKSGLAYEKLQLEYGAFGKHALKEGAYAIRTKDDRWVYDLRFESYEILLEKPDLEGLPSTFGGLETLKITLVSETHDIAVDLFYTTFESQGVLVKSACFRNMSDCSVTIESAQSATYGFNEASYDLTTFSGRWIKEFTTQQHPVHVGKQIYDNLLGVSTHAYQPYIALASKGACETTGDVYGFALVYNGNHQMVVEKDVFNHIELKMGIHPHAFSWQLNPGERFYTPEVISVYSKRGFGGLSHHMHDFVKKHLMRPSVKPFSSVLINSWEAMYFDIDEEKLIALGKGSAKLGVEMLVIDDGWFKNRNNDHSGLGNWELDEIKFPNGFERIARETGLALGLWFEPEMTNNPQDQVIGEGDLTPSRNQFVLDFSDDVVVDAVFEKMCLILDRYPIRWIKWDANRPITEPYSKTIRHQGELFHRYQLGVYKLAKNLTNRYPDLVIESCSAGGGRAGLGMFAYAHSTWLSDQTDAVERLKMQQAASLFLPLSALGSHVTQCPNHQILRTTPLKTRNDVALFGTFGYELNPLVFTEEESAQIQKDISFFKAHRELIHGGRYYRLKSILAGASNEFAHMVVSKDKAKAIVGIYQVLAQSSWEGIFVKLFGLDPEGIYQVGHLEYTGLYLMHVGISFKDGFTGTAMPVVGKLGSGDFSSEILYLEKKA